ncbi:MAG: hypothetical protein ACOYXM_15440 [Actinomycetota bacterium]
MAKLQFDQVNIVVSDVIGAAGFLRALGAEVPELPDEWAEWAPHHIGFPAVADGFDADLDSSAFASHWGGLSEGFTGVVVNLKAEDRDAVDAVFEQAVALGAEVLRDPYDAFFGARYAVVRGPGPLIVGIMSPIDQGRRSDSPSVSDFG